MSSTRNSDLHAWIIDARAAFGAGDWARLSKSLEVLANRSRYQSLPGQAQVIAVLASKAKSLHEVLGAQGGGRGRDPGRRAQELFQDLVIACEKSRHG